MYFNEERGRWLITKLSLYFLNLKTRMQFKLFLKTIDQSKISYLVSVLTPILTADYEKSKSLTHWGAHEFNH